MCAIADVLQIPYISMNVYYICTCGVFVCVHVHASTHHKGNLPICRELLSFLPAAGPNISENSESYLLIAIPV